MDNYTSPTRNGLKKSMGVFVMALLVFGAVAVIMTYSHKAFAQAVLITTSANQFFGNGMVQVIINDPAKNSDSAIQETTSVTVNVKDDTGATKKSDSIDAREIGTNSGQFEFFITGSSTINPAQPRSEAVVANAAVFRANNPTPTGDANDKLEDTTAPLANNWKFEVQYAGAIKTINFKTTTAAFNLDRTTAGSANIVRMIINDQDANIDPTATDTIVGTTPGSGDKITVGGITLITGTFTPGAQTFTETGPNTGVFELPITEGTVTTASTQTFVFTDFDVYQQPAGGPFAITQTSSTITKTLVLQNNDGSLTPVTSFNFASEIPITVTDPDQNKNSRVADSMTSALDGAMASGFKGVRVTAEVDGAVTDTEFVNLKEVASGSSPEENSGVFMADLTDGALPITFVNLAGGIVASDGKIELTADQIANPTTKIVVEYSDPAPHSDAAGTIESTIRLPIAHTPGQLSFQTDKATITDSPTINLNDPDLNDNTHAIDSYTFVTSTSGNTFNLKGTGGASLSNIATFKLTIKGSDTIFSGTSQTVTLIETGENTGIFTGTLDLGKVNPGGANALSDGDQVKLTYTDMMESPSQDSDAVLTIGKPSTAVSVDRTIVPVPLTATEPAAVVGGAPSADTVKFRLSITDPASNTNSGIQETFDASGAAVTMKLTKSTGAALTIGTGAANNIQIGGLTLTETGANTGVFSGLVTLKRGTTASTLKDLDNAKLTFTFDSNTATVTLRASDLVITTDHSVLKNGDALTITLSDMDRNLNSELKDSIPFTVTTQNDAIAAGDTGVFTGTADETDVNSGIFQKTITIGTDIKVTKLGTSTTQATELKIKATDRVSTADTSTDRDVTLKVGTTSGTITVTPDQVGPGTKMVIMVADADLNTNPSGVDKTPAGSDFLTVTTDRTNFPSTKAQGEETGANTGTFKTTIKLTPKTTAANVDPATPTGGDTKDLSNVEVLPGDQISLKYVDNKDASGNKVTVSKVVKVVSVDPEMAADKNDTYGIGDTIKVTVADIDANKDGEAVDSLKLRVTSTSDPVGFEITGLETGPNTGVFTFSVPTTSSVSSGSISVRAGDDVTFKYNDLYPADFATRVKQVADPSKDFFLHVTVGGQTATPNSTTPGKITPTDLGTGQAVSEIKAGQQVQLVSVIHNNDDTPRNFVAIIQVKDSSGVVQAIIIAGSQLVPNGDAKVGGSFTPDVAGTYTVQTFVLSDIGSPTVLATPSTSNLTVS